jgi:hypothetical protein
MVSRDRRSCLALMAFTALSVGVPLTHSFGQDRASPDEIDGLETCHTIFLRVNFRR